MSKTGQPTKKKQEFLKRYPQSPLQDIIDWDDACRAGDGVTAALLNPVLCSFNPSYHNEYYACLAQGYWVRKIGAPSIVSGGGEYVMAFSPLFGELRGDWTLVANHSVRSVLRMARHGEASLTSYVTHDMLSIDEPLPDDFSYRSAVSMFLSEISVHTNFPWCATGEGRIVDMRTHKNHQRCQFSANDTENKMLELVRIIKDGMRNPPRPCHKGIGYEKRLVAFTEKFGYLDCTLGRAIRHIAEWTTF